MQRSGVGLHERPDYYSPSCGEAASGQPPESAPCAIVGEIADADCTGAAHFGVEFKGSGKMLKIGFLGGGNMAGAIAAGLAANGTNPAAIAVMDRHPEKLAVLRERLGIATYEAAGDWISEMDVVVLAVKPQGLEACCAQAARWISPEATVLSIAAAVRSEVIARWLGTRRIVRAMPNTPAMAGKGFTGLYAGEGAIEVDRSRAQAILQAVGAVHWVDGEQALHLVTAGPGSGPAYVFLFMEALADALVEQGLEADAAREFALSTVEGAAALARQSARPFEELRRNVTSKGGTTAKAIEAFEARDLRGTVKAAVEACRARSCEMSDLFC